jgi:hypothetical protein
LCLEDENDQDDSQDEMAFYHVNANSKSRFEVEFDSENKVELGRGGFGHVWKVTGDMLGRKTV